MLENLFNAMRQAQTSPEKRSSGEESPLPGGSDEEAAAKDPDSSIAASEILNHILDAAARINNVPCAVVIRPDEIRRGSVRWQGIGAERILHIPADLEERLVDPALLATVVRDSHGEGLWKKHALAGAVAEIELEDHPAVPVRFAAFAPLIGANLRALDSPGDPAAPFSGPSAGALLLLDEVPHPDWNDAHTATLCDFAAIAALALREAPPAAKTVEKTWSEDEARSQEAKRRADESLRDSERLFRSVVQTAGEAIVLCEPTGQIVAWNEGAARMFGYRAEAVVSRPLRELLARGEEGRRSELDRLCNDLVRRAGEAQLSGRKNAPTSVLEAMARHNTGSEFPVEMSLTAWQGEQSTYVSAFIRDVSARRTTERLRALSHAVARILAEAPSLDEAAGGILRAIGESQSWSTGALWLIKRGPGAAGPVLRCGQVWTQHGVDVRELDLVRRQSSYACGVGLPGRVWAAGEPLWIEDITHDPHISRSSAIVRERMHSAMGFPIRFGHEILGVIDLYAHKPLPTDSGFLEMAAGFGSQIGQFIARKQVETEIRTRARQQAAVARLGQRALSRIGTDALLGEAVALVASTLAVDACSILELMSEDQVFKSRASIGGRPGMLGEIGIAADASTQAGWTLMAREPVVVNDYRNETRFSTSPALEAAGAVSGVSVMIAGSDQPFGVLLAHVAHERHFAADDVHFLEAVSNVLAAALERDRNEKAIQQARDDAERLRAEAEAAREDADKSRLEAERANRAKSAFLSRMSHELRTPLNSILGFVQLLDMDELRPEQEECVRHISHGGTHLLKLINEVLEIARIESGRIAFTLEPVVPGVMVREAMNFVAPLAAQRHIEMHFEDAPAWNDEICADRQRLHEVLLNFLSNAVKYNYEGGDIRVTCAPVPPNRLRVQISDTGMGIAPEFMPRLFDPFDRLGAEKSGIEGTGLGLALAKSLVEAMGGAIGANSVLGQGSDFWMDLPLWAGDGAAKNQQAREADTTRTLVNDFDALRGTVLYIEDNPTNLLLVQRLLGRYPQIELLSAPNGNEGVAGAREQQPDVILLDLHLPDISGSEVLTQLQQEPATRSIPVIVVTADATPAQREKILAAGARDYLVKPLDIGALLRALQATLPTVK